jgi:hypothetical protein
LLGHRIIVHTDHKNLVCKHLNTKRVMRWRLTLLEEYGPELNYIKGANNIVADALSRLDTLPPEQVKEQYEGELQEAECFAGDPEDFPKDFPLSYMEIKHGGIQQQQFAGGIPQQQFAGGIQPAFGGPAAAGVWWTAAAAAAAAASFWSTAAVQ